MIESHDSSRDDHSVVHENLELSNGQRGSVENSLLQVDQLQSPARQVQNEDDFVRLEGSCQDLALLEDDGGNEEDEYGDNKDDDDGYLQEVLVQASACADVQRALVADNQSDLVQALRMSACPAKDAAIEVISQKCRSIVSVCSNADYKHPMRCCCCGQLTELDLPTGVRVLKGTETPHYVCENLIQFIREIEKKQKYNKILFGVYQQCLMNLQKELHP